MPNPHTLCFGLSPGHPASRFIAVEESDNYAFNCFPGHAEVWYRDKPTYTAFAVLAELWNSCAPNGGDLNAWSREFYCGDGYGVPQSHQKYSQHLAGVALSSCGPAVILDRYVPLLPCPYRGSILPNTKDFRLEVTGHPSVNGGAIISGDDYKLGLVLRRGNLLANGTLGPTGPWPSAVIVFRYDGQDPSRLAHLNDVFKLIQDAARQGGVKASLKTPDFKWEMEAGSPVVFDGRRQIEFTQYFCAMVPGCARPSYPSLRFDDPDKAPPPCQHEWVNAGFTRVKWVCAKCDADMPADAKPPERRW
jgi:hypothetical protein